MMLGINADLGIVSPILRTKVPVETPLSSAILTYLLPLHF